MTIACVYNPPRGDEHHAVVNAPNEVTADDNAFAEMATINDDDSEHVLGDDATGTSPTVTPPNPMVPVPRGQVCHSSHSGVPTTDVMIAPSSHNPGNVAVAPTTCAPSVPPTTCAATVNLATSNTDGHGTASGRWRDHGDYQRGADEQRRNRRWLRREGMPCLQIMKTLLLALLFSLSSVSFAEDYYPLDAPENTALFVAIAKGDFKKAETLLEVGVNPNKKSVRGGTVFTALSLNDDEQGSIDFLLMLIRYGADVNEQNEDGDTGLNTAIMRDKYQLAQAFIRNKKVDVNIGNKYSHTSAHLIVNPGYENIELLEFLVSQKKADLNKQTNHGNTPVLISLRSVSEGLYYALYPEEGVTPNAEQIGKAAQSAQIILDSPHDINLTIKNKHGESLYSTLEILKEHLPKLPKDSDFYPAFEPIRRILSSGKYISHTQ